MRYNLPLIGGLLIGAIIWAGVIWWLWSSIGCSVATPC